MKRIVVKRSAEELEKFFRKSSSRLVIKNLSNQKLENKPKSLHQIIENAVLKLDFPSAKELSLIYTEIQETNVDNYPLGIEEKE